MQIFTVEEEQPNNIARQSQTSNDHDQLWRRDLGRGYDPPNRLQRDRHAQRHKEDTVNERTEDLGSLPPVRVGR
jgi:hypothetical protein